MQGIFADQHDVEAETNLRKVGEAERRVDRQKNAAESFVFRPMVV